jgi:hypothetical protein
MADKATVVYDVSSLIPPGQTDPADTGAATSHGGTDLTGSGSAVVGVIPTDDDPTSHAAAWQWLHSHMAAGVGSPSVSGGHGDLSGEGGSPLSVPFVTDSGATYAVSLATISDPGDGFAGSSTKSGATTNTVSVAGSGLVFHNTFESSVTTAYMNNIITAEQTLAGLWTNSVTLNMDFKGAAQGRNGDLATNSWSSFVNVTYAQLKSALTAHNFSSFSAAAIASLPATDPNPASGADWALPVAYARMLGLTTLTPAIDDTITLNTSYSWSYGPDVVNTLEHEISEGGMGRVGGLGDQNGVWSTMDLFRYSAAGIRDYTDGRDSKTTYFSYDGTTLSKPLSFNNEYSGSTFNNSGDTADFTQQDVFGIGNPGETNTLSQTDFEIMDVLGWHPTPAYDFYFVYNDYVTGGAKGDFYLGTVSDNGSFGYTVGEKITTSLGYYYIYQSAGTTMQASGTVNDYYYYDGSATGKAYTPYYSQNSGYSPGTGLGNDLDYILGVDGAYHLFGGNTAEAKGGTSLYDFYFVYNDYVTGGAKGDLYYGTVADSGSFGYTVGEKITTSLGYYYIYQSAGTTMQASGTVEDYYYYDGAGTGQAYIPYYAYYYGSSPGNGLKTDLDYILGADGLYHLFGGNTAEAIVTTSKAGTDIVSSSTSSSPGVTTIIGAAGDVIVGGSGSDLINAMAGSAAITVGSGPTTVWGGLGDVITGGSGTLLIDGTLGGQQITGGPGISTILGGAGDTISGSTGAGSSTIVGMAGDTVTGGSGSDLINALAGSQAIFGGSGHATVWGGGSGDTITGGQGQLVVDIDHANYPGSVLVGNNGAKGDTTVTGFSQIAGDRLFFQNETSASITSVIASAQTTSGGNTLITLPDGATMTLIGITKLDATFFA